MGPDHSTALRSRWFAVAAALLLLAYGVFIGVNFAPVAAGADSGGYMISAKLLTEGRLTTVLRPVPELGLRNVWEYTALGTEGIQGTTILRPTYPIGLPLHYAVAVRLAGWHWGILLVGVAGAVAAVWLCYRLLRELAVSRALAVAGAVALAVSPQFLFTSFVPLSDTISAAWNAAAVLAALRARKVRGWAWAGLCGAAFAMAVLVRPSNIVLLPALVLLLGNWRAWLGAFVGGLPGAGWMAYYNHVMYGSAARSGYGPIFDIFMRQYFWPSVENYATWLPRLLPLTAALLLVPLLPWRQRWREISALLLWFLSFALFFAFYEFTHYTWWYLRFILPAFPAVVVLGAWGIDAALVRCATGRARRLVLPVAAGVVIAVSLGLAVKEEKNCHVMLLKSYQKPYTAACDWARANLPADSLVACMQLSGSFFFYTDFPILRWDTINRADYARLQEGLAQSGRPFYALLFPFEREEQEAFTKHIPGQWEKVAEVHEVGIWKYRGP